MEEEEIGSIRKMMPAMDYPLIHDFVASSPVFSREIEGLDMVESALMGNLLTDMLGGQFYGSNRPFGPDLLQFSGDQSSSKMSFLQMLEETEVGKEAPDDPFHLKLPILEEQPDQKNFSHSPEISSKSCKVETNPQSEENDEENAENENCSAKKSEKFAGPANSGHSSERQAENNNNNQGGQIGSDVPISQSSSGTENQTKPKRKRAKSSKNSEEVESQRQTHIAVERNRRKQMNEHLGVLRSLMPGSYVQRGDQASIIGGAIEFVKELEQLLQCLQAQKRRKMYAEVFSPKMGMKASTNPSANPAMGSSITAQSADSKYISENLMEGKEELAESKSEIADVEVKMVGSDALVKILSQRRPGQLLKAIAGLESLCLVILHTNVTTIEQTVLYSFNVKLGLECRLSVDEIAAAVQQIFTMIHSGACIA